MRKKNIFSRKSKIRIGEYNFETEANHSSFIQTRIQSILQVFKNSDRTQERDAERSRKDITHYPDFHKSTYHEELSGIKSTKDISYINNKNDEELDGIYDDQLRAEIFKSVYGPPPYEEINKHDLKTFEEQLNEIKGSIEKFNYDLEKITVFHNNEEKQEYINILKNINDELDNLEQNGLFDFEIILCGEESKTDENETRRLLIEKRSADVNDQKQRVNELLLRLTNVK